MMTTICHFKDHTVPYINSGHLNINENKTQPKYPDYRGTLNADGIAYWISGWWKTGKDGKPFLSLSLREKDEQIDDDGTVYHRSDELDVL